MATLLSSCNAQGAAGAAEPNPKRIGDGRDGCMLLNFPWCREDMCKDLTKDKHAYCNDKGECCPTYGPPAPSSRKSLREHN
ncbi:hypothetical protein ABZP36_009836 [Zizania latifolia]